MLSNSSNIFFSDSKWLTRVYFFFNFSEHRWLILYHVIDVLQQVAIFNRTIYRNDWSREHVTLSYAWLVGLVQEKPFLFGRRMESVYLAAWRHFWLTLCWANYAYKFFTWCPFVNLMSNSHKNDSLNIKKDIAFVNKPLNFRHSVIEVKKKLKLVCCGNIL